MIHVVLPDDRQRLLVFYLAMEEYLAAHLDRLAPPGENGLREAFFLWQVPPTVIFGRNQVMEAEVNLEYCRTHQVHLFRRKSGGGCVYSDLGNIMLSYITDCTEVASSFDVFLEEVAGMLTEMGLDAARSGRNDILVSGRKVSGNSLFLLPHSAIVHGTLLYDTDFEALEEAITPSAAKISSKGVASVRQHVTNIKEELFRQGSPLLDKILPEDGRDIDKSCKLEGIECFKDQIVTHFCGNEKNRKVLRLSEEEVAEIGKIEATYLDPAFLSGRRHQCSLSFEGRVEGAGEIRVELEMQAGQVERIWLRGDIFPLREDAEETLTRRLQGQPLERGAFREALRTVRLEEYVLNFHTADFLDLVFGK